MTPYLTIHAAADETAMKALSAAVRGDACVRADTSAVYLLTSHASGGYATAANWRRLPGLSSLVAAAAATRQPAVDLASLDVDAGGPWQGRKYAVGDSGSTGTDEAAYQEREFPRIAYADGSTASAQWPRVSDGGAVYWDWEETTDAAVVPETVLIATLVQADSILDGSRDRRMAAIRDGLASQSVGSLSESYRTDIVLAEAAQPLTDRAARLMVRYRLRTGRML
jgi:hypothetical protein